MISLSMAKPAIPPAIRSALQRLGVGVAVTALADWLFYLHPPGISIVIFAAALGIAVLLTNPIGARRSDLLGAVVILVAALLPSVELFGAFSFVFAILGPALFALLATGWPARPAIERVSDLLWMIIGGPFQLVDDIAETAREVRERDVTRHGANWLKAWVVPLGVGGVFLALFAAANPVIESWFAGGGRSWTLDVDAGRVFSWVVVFALIWGFLRVRLRSIPFTLPSVEPEWPAAPAADAAQTPAVVGVLFGRTAILRSLVLFNALFGVQTVLDIAYLWSGVALPAGMTYASYAHRGVYALMLAALLAGAFVLAAMRPGSETERSRPIRALVLLWIGQTGLLVISSMLRLDLYVDVYLLTEWRCAAFVGMLLVVVGLVLISARIVLGRSNRLAGLAQRRGAGVDALCLQLRRLLRPDRRFQRRPQLGGLREGALGRRRVSVRPWSCRDSGARCPGREGNVDRSTHPNSTVPHPLDPALPRTPERTGALSPFVSTGLGDTSTGGMAARPRRSTGRSGRRMFRRSGRRFADKNMR